MKGKGETRKEEYEERWKEEEGSQGRSSKSKVGPNNAARKFTGFNAARRDGEVENRIETQGRRPQRALLMSTRVVSSCTPPGSSNTQAPRSVLSERRP
jgi:hypothetical protein